MPAFLLHVGATVQCFHSGTAQPMSMYPRVMLGGQPIVTQQNPYVIIGCGLAATSNPFCTSAQWTTAATRVRAGGMQVLLQDSQALCAPTGTGLNVLATQMRVRGT